MINAAVSRSGNFKENGDGNESVRRGATSGNNTQS